MTRLIIYPSNEAVLYDTRLRMSKSLGWDVEDFRRADVPMERHLVVEQEDDANKAWKCETDNGVEWVIFPTHYDMLGKTRAKAGRPIHRKSQSICGVMYLECTKCSVMKPEDDFFGCKKSPFGRQSRCKRCANDALRDLRARKRS